MPSRFINKHVGGNTTYARHIKDGLESRGIEVVQFGHGAGPLSVAVRESLAARKARRGDDVIHFVADTGPMLGSSLPMALTVHGVASRWITTARNPQQERLWRLRVRRAISAAGRVITVSRSSADDIATVFGISRELVSVIPHGVDVTPYTRPRPLPPRFNTQISRPYALYVGNIEPRKNLVPLVQAFSLPQVRNLGLKLVIAGKPAWNYAASLEAIASSPDTIYLGFVSEDERIGLLQHAAVFLFPSLYEGFGFPVVEALAAGTPVLTSNRGSLAEVAGPSKIVDSLSTEGIAQAIADALNDTPWLRSIRTAGPAWASRFSWDDSVERHIEVYQELAAQA